MGFYDSNKLGEPDEQIELDLTNAHLPNLDDVEIKPSLEVTVHHVPSNCASAVQAMVLSDCTLRRTRLDSHTRSRSDTPTKAA